MPVPIYYLPVPVDATYYIRTVHLVTGVVYNFATDAFVQGDTVSWANASFELPELPGGFGYLSGYFYNFANTDPVSPIIASIFKQLGDAPAISDLHVADIMHNIEDESAVGVPDLTYYPAPPPVVYGPMRLLLNGTSAPDGNTGEIVYVGERPTLRMFVVDKHGSPVALPASITAKITRVDTGATVGTTVSATRDGETTGIADLQLPSAATDAALAGKRLRVTLSFLSGGLTQIAGEVSLEVRAQ